MTGQVSKPVSLIENPEFHSKIETSFEEIYQFLWNVPKEKRKEVLRGRLSYHEFVQIFGKEHQKMKVDPSSKVKITIPHPFTFDNAKKSKRFYEHFLQQILIDFEESQKLPEFKPFLAKKIPKGILEPIFERQRSEIQRKKQIWKEKSFLIRRKAYKTEELRKGTDEGPSIDERVFG